MSPKFEEMGEVPRRLRFLFALSSVAFVAALAVSPVKDLRREWKRYKRGYVRYAQTRADSRRLLADYRPEIDQIWIPEMNVVDRCTTCHQGITQASLADPAVPQPFRAHPRKIGRASCREREERGVGRRRWIEKDE